MKRLISVILAAILLVSVAMAENERSKEFYVALDKVLCLSQEELKDMKNVIDGILLEYEKKNTNNTDKLLCNSNGFKVYITGDIQFDYDVLYNKKKLVIPITAINESDKQLNLKIEKISFNGWEVDNIFTTLSLDANKKLKENIDVLDFLDKTNIVSTFEIKEIEAYYRIMDYDYNTITDNCRTTVILK